MIGNFFIQPFDISYNKYQRYIYVAIDGNRVYREFYAIIDNAVDGNVKIMVIAMCHDGNRLTFVNNMEDYNYLKEKIGTEKLYYSPIKLLTRENKNFVYLDLFFRSNINEKIEIKLYCIKKLYKEKRAIRKKNNVFAKSSSTIFYSSKIMRAASKSSITIMGREYEISTSLKFPFVRKLKMLYIQDLGIINIYNKIRTFKTIEIPELICVNSKFTYECNGEKTTYNVEKITDDLVFLSSPRDKIVARNAERGLAILKIFITMHPEAPEITFTPPIKIIPNEEDEFSRHKVTLTMGTSTVFGDIIYKGKKENGFILKFVCDKIGWTNESPLVSSVVFSEDGFKITTGIIENDFE